MPVRLGDHSTIIVDTHLKFGHVYQKNLVQFYTNFSSMVSTIKGDVQIEIFHFTNIFFNGIQHF